MLLCKIYQPRASLWLLIEHCIYAQDAFYHYSFINEMHIDSSQLKYFIDSVSSYHFLDDAVPFIVSCRELYS